MGVVDSDSDEAVAEAISDEDIADSDTIFD